MNAKQIHYSVKDLGRKNLAATSQPPGLLPLPQSSALPYPLESSALTLDPNIASHLVLKSIEQTLEEGFDSFGYFKILALNFALI